MAGRGRGRPPGSGKKKGGPEKPSTNGPDPDTMASYERKLNMAYDEVEEAQQPFKEAQGRLRVVIAAGKGLGLNMNSLVRVVKAKRNNPEAFQRQLDDDVVTARTLGMKLSPQFDFLPKLDIPEHVQLQIKLTDVEHAGYQVGRGGGDRTNNPHKQGTDTFVEWDGGWLRGQRQNLPGKSSAPTVKPAAPGPGPELDLKGNDAPKPFTARVNGAWTDHKGFAHSGPVILEARLEEVFQGGFAAFSPDHTEAFQTRPDGLKPAELIYWNKGYMAAREQTTKTGTPPTTAGLNARLVAASVQRVFTAHTAIADLAERDDYTCRVLVAKLPDDVGPQEAFVTCFAWTTPRYESGGEYTEDVRQLLLASERVAYLEGAILLKIELLQMIDANKGDPTAPVQETAVFEAWAAEVAEYVQRTKSELAIEAEKSATILEGSSAVDPDADPDGEPAPEAAEVEGEPLSEEEEAALAEAAHDEQLAAAGPDEDDQEGQPEALPLETVDDF